MRVRRRHATPFILLIIGVTLLVLTLRGEPSISEAENVEEILARLTDRQLCWMNEKYTIAEPCIKCSDEDIRESPDLCQLTGYRQRVVCDSSGESVKSCQVQEWEEEVRFWAFEAAAAVVGVFGGLSLAVRRHTLPRRHIPLGHDTLHCLPGITV